MTRRTILFFLAALLLLQPAQACLNESRVTLQGGQVEAGTLEMELVPGQYVQATPAARDFIAARADNLRRLSKLSHLWDTQHMLSDYSDYGVVLVYLGRYEQARAVFTAIEARQPGLYATAANLGTVYELLGQNERALYWIQRAVRINPRSHYGSEWIHVNILRAKLRGAGAVNARFLLGTDFGTAATPVTTISQTSLKHLRAALYFQLAERMSFIKPKDAVVGQLLFELGNTYALTSDVESALDVYDQARAYGYGGGVLARRYAYFQWLKYREDFLGLLVLLGLLGLAGFGALRLGRGLKRAYRRRISKQEAAPAAIEVSSRARADKVGARPGRPD